MKKFLLCALVLLVSIAFVGTGFAKEHGKEEKPPVAAEKPAAVEKPAPPAEEKPAAEAPAPDKAVEKPKPKPIPGFVGTVVKTDTIFNTVGVQRGKETVFFDVSGAKLKGYKSLDDIHVGDRVSMLYKKDALTVLKLSGAKKR